MIVGQQHADWFFFFIHAAVTSAYHLVEGMCASELQGARLSGIISYNSPILRGLQIETNFLPCALNNAIRWNHPLPLPSNYDFLAAEKALTHHIGHDNKKETKMSMYFADIAGHENPSKKLSKVAVVGLAHVVLGYGLIQSISDRHIVMPPIMDEMITLVPPKIVPPPPPPEPPKAKPKTVTPPKALVPPPEVDVEPQVEPEQVIQAEVMQESEPMAEPSTQGDAAPSTNSSADGTMRTAVFAEGCATPEYPARAARNGETGTVQLALLVGADGRVSSSRVSKSSGSRDLDRAAVQALTLCKFKPAVNNGQAEAGWAQIAYEWTLKD